MKNLIISLIFLTACEFRIEDEDAKNQLESVVNIQFGDLTVDKRNMHYAFTDQGKDILVVFIHGSPGSWNAFIDYFNNDTLVSSYDILSIDRPGFGKSNFGQAESSLVMQSYLINEVLKEFPTKEKILIGHSLGGPVIARMAMDFSDAYKGLVMIAPSIDPNMEKKEWYRAIIDTEVGAVFTPKEFEVSNSEILTLKEELLDMLPLWESISIPIIVIQGTDDSLVPRENAYFAERMLRDSLISVQMLDGVNHFIPWSHPEEVVKAIEDISGLKLY